MNKILWGLIMLAAATVAYGANEITLSGNLSATKNYSNVKEQPASLQVDWTGDKSFQYTLTTSLTPQAIPSTGFASNGLAFFRNNSTNIAVRVGFRGSTTTPDLELLPGEYQFLRLATGSLTTNIYAWAYNPSTNNFTVTNANFYVRILEN
jgi:hypothetical protein